MGNTTPEFATELEKLKQEIPVGTLFHHYKHTDKIYRIVLHGFWEATGEPAIVYQRIDGDKSTWIRTAKVFLENVEWDGKIVPRFSRVE
jgi:hypothetical protein